MEVLCEFFELENDNFIQEYICSVKYKQIYEGSEIIFIGKHENGKTNDDVTGFWLWYCNVTKVPHGLTKVFPNLRFLSIFSTNLKNLTKNDLIEYKNLERFDLNYNQIKFLPDNLFEGFKNLKKITFTGNHLELIEPNILDGLNNLREVSFKENPNYDLRWSFDEAGMSLDEVKGQLYEKFLTKVPGYVRNFMVKCNQKVVDLKNLNDILIQENQALRNNLSKKFVDPTPTFNGFDIKKFLAEDNCFRDFSIIVKNREYRVHKFVFAARSPLFAYAFRSSPESKEIKFHISPEVFEKVLKFLYTDELPCGEGTNIIHLFVAAGKLGIKDLMDFAAMKMFELIDEENAFEFLALSNKYHHDGLRQKAYDEIKKRYPEIEFKDEWAFQTENVARIIGYEGERQMLKIFDEENPINKFYA